MIKTFENADIIRMKDFSAEQVLFLLDTASDMNKFVKEGTNVSLGTALKGKRLISAFFEDSTRTRNSFEWAMKYLGGKVMGFAGPQGTSLNKNESIYHTIKMFEGYGGEAIVVRHKLDGVPQFLADKFDMPVLNAGDGVHEHPSQALLDMYSIKETQGKLEGLNVGFVGDMKYGRTFHSLITGLSLFPGNTFYFVSPEYLKMPKRYLEMLENRGAKFVEEKSLEKVIDELDILYAGRLQKERLQPDIALNYDEIKTEYQITASRLSGARPNLKILHPLPIDKLVMEIAGDVESLPNAYYFSQAKNGLYIRMALLGLTMGGLPSNYFNITEPERRPTNFKEVHITPKSGDKKKIAHINHGIVIDHLPPGSNYDVLKIMGYSDMPNISIGQNLASEKYGLKDIIKIESDSLGLGDLESLNKLKLRYPNTTLSLVHDGIVVMKGKVELPSEVIGLVRCVNGNCVSRPEHNESVLPRFNVIDRDKPVLECRYCDTTFGREELYFLKHG